MTQTGERRSSNALGRKPWLGRAVAVAWLGLAGCASVGVGITLPIPGVGSVGVSVDSSGRVGAGVSVGAGPVSVGVGGTAQLPPPGGSKPERSEPVAQGASGATGAASSPNR